MTVWWFNSEMATFAAVDLIGSIEVGGNPHTSFDQLIKPVGLMVADIIPLVGSVITPTSDLVFTLTEDNTGG